MNKISAVFKTSLLASAVALTGCGGDGDDSSSPQARTGVQVGGNSISAQGGDATLGRGGSGGDVYVYKYNSASALNVQRQGVINADYTLPEQTPQFGSNAVVLTATETAQLVNDDGDETNTSAHLPDAGKLYLIDRSMLGHEANPDLETQNLYRLYKSDGVSAIGADNTEVTGLTIDAGVTLILKDNDNYSRIRLNFKNDVQNDGLLVTDNETVSQRLALQLTIGAYYGTGQIDLSGSKPGQAGGSLTIYAHTIKNSGEFKSNGGGNTETGVAGNGGSIELYANIFVENTGALSTNGGISATSTSGQGGYIELAAIDVYNTGELNANKGLGFNSSNSNYGEVYISAAKNLINTGNINVLGDTAQGDGNYRGGDGGDIYMELTNTVPYVGLDKALVNTGDLNVDGGDIAGESSGNAGNGGDIYIQAGDYNTIRGNSPDSTDGAAFYTSINISGNISANGGSNTLASEYGQGGVGGEIALTVYDQTTSTVGSYLVGYNNINASAGDGMDGGYAGGIDIISGDHREERGGSYVPALSGPLSNSVDLIANGGHSLATEEDSGYGENGGYINLAIQNGYAYLQPDALHLTNTGAISADGGNSFNDSANGRGGNVTVMAPGAVTIENSVSVNGGSDKYTANAGVGYGAHAGSIALVSQYNSNAINASISANGGDGNRAGGNAGFIMFAGKTSLNAQGSIGLNGGNAVVDATDAINTEGGDAGEMSMISEAYNSVLAATVTAEAGQGDEPGITASIMVDADCKSDYCNIETMYGEK